MLDAQFAAAPRGDLELDLPPLESLGEQLVAPELLQRHDLQAGRVLAHARNLERVEDDDAAPVLLGVQERVRDQHRHLVAQLWRAHRVAVDQDVGHAAILTA